MSVEAEALDSYCASAALVATTAQGDVDELNSSGLDGDVKLQPEVVVT